MGALRKMKGVNEMFFNAYFYYFEKDCSSALNA